ncbi:MAG: uroporphyrinogen-III C-methyltransferase [Myxococcales bacterium]|nr:uroporphyrinogen-III C-methyltransferase [Myxococcales bacterium]
MSARDRHQSVSRVYLVGAGPGELDLCTVRGRDLALDCDVLVYDSLVPPELVQQSRATSKLYVGKTRDGHALTQPEINAALVRLACEAPGGRSIVRLKGGDPFLFGRGGEEVRALLEAEIPFEVVPGVTAATAAAASALVPLTDRDFSAGVVIVTGHRRGESSESLPWRHLVGCKMTLVFYMALRQLETITRELIAHGMGAETTALLVQEATLPGQRIVHERLERIAERASEVGLRPPAVLIVGPVAALFDQTGVAVARPLAGCSVLVLRPSERRYLELNRLRDMGARVFDPPIVRSVPSFGDGSLQELRRKVSSADLLVFTSALAVHLFDEWRRHHDALPLVPACWGVRASVRAELERLGFGAPTQAASAEDDVGDLSARVEAARRAGCQRVWILGRGASERRLAAVRAHALDVRSVQLYRQNTLALPNDIVAALSEGRIDLVLFISSSTVEAFGALVDGLERAVVEGLRFVAISEGLAFRVRERLGVDCVAPSASGLDELIELAASTLCGASLDQVKV